MPIKNKALDTEGSSELPTAGAYLAPGMYVHPDGIKTIEEVVKLSSKEHAVVEVPVSATASP